MIDDKKNPMQLTMQFSNRLQLISFYTCVFYGFLTDKYFSKSFQLCYKGG